MAVLPYEPFADSSRQSVAPVCWSDRLHGWCVHDVGLVIEILKSPDFVVVDYAGEYAKIEQRTGINFAQFATALHHIPLANEGERHARSRRDFAHLIRARSAVVKDKVSRRVSELLPTVFQAGGCPELMRDVVRPVTDCLFAGLLGFRAPPSDGPSPSQIFDRFLSLNRRKLVQREVTHLRQTFTANAEALTISPEYAIAFMIVGYDSVMASIGTCLESVFREGSGRRLCDLTYSPTLPRTGVPYVERVAKSTRKLRGFEFHPGDRVRLFLGGRPNQDRGETLPYFGKGRHLCLGMDLSQWLWGTLAEGLATLPVEVRIVEARIRPNDYVFNMYDRLKVSVHG